MQCSQEAVAPRVQNALVDFGVVGTGLREELSRDLTSKLLLRQGRDHLHVVGPTGSGKNLIANVAHALACDVLGREDQRVDLSCRDERLPAAWSSELRQAVAAADGGTLVLNGYEDLDPRKRTLAGEIFRDATEQPLVISIARSQDSRPDTSRPLTRIEMRPLHQREADIQELLTHFFEQTAVEAGLTGCRGLSRQVMADITEAIRDVQLGSVRMMRDLVRDLVFEVVASGISPLKITSEHVRPLLAQKFGQTDERRLARETERIEALCDEPVRNALVAHLAELHGVPAEVLERQMASLEQVIASMDDAPRSYRNIMTRADDILRSGLWLLSGANTQAEFRRFFGEERFMKPTKSVAWAFYNRVFKRDV